MPDQRSVTDQLRDIIVYANRKGMYDAADLIQRSLRPEFRVTTAEILMAVIPDGTETG
jgi:hypothetical protein